MSLHVNELKGNLLNLLAELGVILPYSVKEQIRATEPPLALNDHQMLLLQAFRSGQIAHWAWEEHLADDTSLRNYLQSEDRRREPRC